MYSAGPELEGKERANLADVLKFVTGARTMPPRGYAFGRKLRFSYHNRKFPESSSCFLHLALPSGCSNFEEFCCNFDKAVLWSLVHFGRGVHHLLRCASDVYMVWEIRL